MGAVLEVREDTLHTEGAWRQWNETCLDISRGVVVFDVTPQGILEDAEHLQRVVVQVTFGLESGDSGLSGGGVTVLVVRVDGMELGELGVKEMVWLMLQRESWPEVGIDCVHPVFCAGAKRLGVMCVRREGMGMYAGEIGRMSVEMDVDEEVGDVRWAVCVVYWTWDCPGGFVTMRASSLRL